jgi:hypothetical protein
MSIRSFFAATLLLGLVPIVSASWAQDWRDQASYPARVKAIQFKTLLDKDHAVEWWGWHVRIGSEPPMATTLQFDIPSACVAVLVNALVCSRNPGGDGTSCGFEFRPACKDKKEHCLLRIGMAPPSTVDCPHSIVLIK